MRVTLQGTCPLVWIIGDSYVQRGAQRDAETKGSNLSMPDVPHIRHDHPRLFLKDGVNFTPRGNYMFLSTLANCHENNLQMLRTAYSWRCHCF